ncbi:rust resistance kinase Lr10-like isoform X4 [Triticum aestivum]|nr:rust resistance kinase Lr10-like isoform X4 [Triticum aestivum]XP_044355209.1 rust resistance kinase Lr10-like isoform X4 [Triticum aestivum]
MRPFGSYTTRLQQNASYADIMQFIRRGFSVQFPEMHADPGWPSVYEAINICLNNSTSYYKQQISGANILNWTRTFFWGETHFLKCIAENTDSMIFIAVVKAIISAIDIPKFLIVLCRFLLAPLSVLIFLAQKYWKTRITIDAVEKFLRMQQMLGPMRYAYTDITAITGHFRDKLGQGGYGSVYKGVLLPGDVHVAVKMLAGNSNCNAEDFISEVSTIGRIHHVNVVRLVGFCSEEMKRGLVYEYMPRGSLDKYIFSDEKCFSLDKLNEIALGIASGINYLHEGCDMQILHFDIKQHNILLDSNFTPKVADFGLAKLCPRGDNFVPLSALRGTVGYIAPEMISRGFGVISSKSDVYSFGMLLLEMAGGRRNADPDAPNSSQAYYPSWVYDRLTEQEAGEISIVDDMHELEKKLCIIGLWCIQMKSHDRPTMSEVIEMLEGGANSLQMPSRPFFCDEGHIHTDDTYHLSSELTEISEEDD